MNNPKHTKGPLFIEATDDTLFIVREDGAAVAQVELSEANIDNSEYPSLEECKANARLIAAAPELLSVARELEFLIKKYDIGAIPARLRQDLKNAIAKATGGAE